MTNPWINFLKKNKNKGYSMKELSERYCKEQLKKKIDINIKEGKFSSRKQAIAVAYSQVKKRSPVCKKVFKK
jgi:hypothetical protein